MSADEGAPLHPVARDLLAQFRAQDDMPADARARVRRRLEADDVAPAREGRRDGRSWIVWSLVGAAAGVALLLGLKAIAPSLGEENEAAKLEAAPDRVQRDAATSRASAREAKAAKASREAAPIELTPAPAIEPPTPAPTTMAAEVEPEIAPSPRRARKPELREPSVTPAEPEPVPPSSTLDAERRLLAQAWNALAEGDPAAAIASATSHRDRFPQGLLAPERTAIEAIARCKRDNDVTRAHAFLKTHARSPLATRVREACGLVAPRAGSSEERTPTGR